MTPTKAAKVVFDNVAPGSELAGAISALLAYARQLGSLDGKLTGSSGAYDIIYDGLLASLALPASGGEK